jgi:hypothetical protein
MANIHGNRLLSDQLERKGSGFTAKHGGDFLMANDTWFRALQAAYGPDGGVFVSDWNDFGECHDSDGSYRSSGRIYKITYGNPKPAGDLDLAKLSDAELVKLQLHPNDWYVRHARRLLQERAAVGKLGAGVQAALTQIVRGNADVPKKLRALWALHATGGLEPQVQPLGDPRLQKQPLDLRGPRLIGPAPSPLLMELLGHKDENLRWWAVQLLCEGKSALPDVLQQFATMAREDQSPFVRLSIASALQRLPLANRWTIAERLADHAEDATDQNLPLMIWYAIEPAVPGNRAEAVRFAGRTKIPLLREFIVRRLAAAGPTPSGEK